MWQAIFNENAAVFSGSAECSRPSLQLVGGLLQLPQTLYELWWPVSAYQPISASIIQGSAIGPVFFVVNASDLSTVTPGNRMHKYADDTYIVIPACNNRTREVELDHVALWAQENNRKRNRTKSTEIVFTDSRRKSQFSPPPTLPDVSRVSLIKILSPTICLLATTFVT